MHGDPAAGASVRIVEPADGEVLPAGAAIIRVQAAGVAEEDLHWHLYVDGEQQGMISGLETELELAPGTHELSARIASGDEHEEVSDAPQSTVNVFVEP
jgi:hypothetical protein